MKIQGTHMTNKNLNNNIFWSICAALEIVTKLTTNLTVFNKMGDLSFMNTNVKIYCQFISQNRIYIYIIKDHYYWVESSSSNSRWRISIHHIINYFRFRWMLLETWQVLNWWKWSLSFRCRVSAFREIKKSCWSSFIASLKRWTVNDERWCYVN